MIYRVITGRLTARTAVHVGAGEGTETTDALIRRDAAGEPIIPGTAIAGALRALLTRLGPRLRSGVCQALEGGEISCDCGVCRLFGDVNPSDEEGARSKASRLLVFNGKLSQGGQTLIRDSVGINRSTGAAERAGAAKFDLEMLPAGTTFIMRLELRCTAPEDEQLLAAALAEWRAGRAWLGGRVARGLGAFTLDGIQCVERDLNQPDQLMAFLDAKAPWRGATEETGWLEAQLKEARAQLVNEYGHRPPIAHSWVSFEGTLQAQGALLTNDTTQAGLTGFDHTPLLTRLNDWQHPVLTGAGLRGVLRSHAERIARTLATLHARDGDHFREICPACDPTTRRPSRETSPSELPALESCDSLLLYQAGRSGDEVVKPEELCLACRLFGSSRIGSRLLVEDAPYAGQGPPTLKMLDFLAIDRFTGGGAEKLKFDALALWRPVFTLRLHLDNPEHWELGWLALVFRDLAEGWLSVGYGAAKGFGRVKLTDWKVSFGHLGKDKALELEPMPEATQEGVYTVVRGDSSQPTSWLSLSETWVAEFRETLLGEVGRPGFRRESAMVFAHDSYFRQVKGQWVHKLYPKEVAVEVERS